MTIDPETGRQTSGLRPNERECRPVREVLERHSRQDVAVEPDIEVDLEPDGEYGHLFQRVELASFDDLTALKLVPERLEERSVRAAIARDDDEALRLSRERLRTGPPRGAGGCGCGEHSHAEGGPAHEWAQQRAVQAVATDFRSDLRSTYEEVRKAHHPALAKVVSESTRQRIPWDDIELRAIHRWTTVIDRARTTVIDIIISLIQDLTIGRNATLNVSSKATSMLVNDIRIHVGGRMVVKSPFISINCASVRGDIS